jgi:sporulation protein YqfC
VPQPVGRRVAHWLDVPDDVLLQVPRVELVGGLQARITNHRGLVRFDQNRVSVRLPHGRLELGGDALVVGWIDRESVLITGHIATLELVDGDG